MKANRLGLRAGDINAATPGCPGAKAACGLISGAAADVHADETSIRQIDIEKKAYIWDFVTPDLIVYCYATDRSGDTPKRPRTPAETHARPRTPASFVNPRTANPVSPWLSA